MTIQSVSGGFKQNGEYLSPQQALNRSKMLDGLLGYYYKRYSAANCCGSVDVGYNSLSTAAITMRYEQLKVLYTDELGMPAPD